MCKNIFTEDEKSLYNECVKIFGDNCIIKKLTGGGSSRNYYRICYDEGKKSVIGVIGNDIKENRAFIKLTEVFAKNGVRVPTVIYSTPNEKIYFLTDLGDTSLLDYIKNNKKIKICEQALDELVKMQNIPISEWFDFTLNTPFSKRLILWDLNYFKYSFFKLYEIPFDENELENEFESFADSLISSGCPVGFMYRDFQSRNIMIKDQQTWLIDYQGGRVGPLFYDLVSFIWQAKADFNDIEKRELTNYYLKKLIENKLLSCEIKIEDIEKVINRFSLFRILQVLGAYGLRGLIQKKQHFMESIPQAIKNLKNISDKGVIDDYPELKRICKALIHKILIEEEKYEGLTVTVRSFSFKNGSYPDSIRNNGGGFVFDCRGMENPGRVEELKNFTGRDKEVVDFLKKYGEADDFVENAFRIVAPSVDNYIKRSFDSLEVNFGCTGGRHRSVYCAEQFAKKISEAYPNIKVIISHREQPYLN